MHGSLDQSIFPYNSQIRNPRNVQHYNFSSLRSAASLPPPLEGLLPPPFLSQSYIPYGPPLLPLFPANPRHKQSGNGGRSSNPKKVKIPKQKNQKSEGRISPKKIDSVIGNGFSGSLIYGLSPPPSSLPMPTFSLRPKLRCNAAAGIDSGATDNLRLL